jgi:putative tricarboxylic transport membrane protein
MSSKNNSAAASDYTVSYRSVDAAVALLFMAISCVVMWDSHNIGSAWVSDGPQAGYFPFYIGLIMFIASLGTLVQALITKTPNLNTFVEKGQLWSVLQVLVPTAVFVALIPYLGIYLSGALFIAFFMVFIGKYNVLKAIPIALIVPIALFMLFEIWFLIPLPKGPVEAALGY